MGAQGSLLRSIVSGLISQHKRGTAFGVFDTIFGVAWFGGSWLMGALYDYSMVTLVLFSVLCQLLGLPLFIIAGARSRQLA
jgi:MFS-type transporter involved in bile tolerance (Atg22 family)